MALVCGVLPGPQNVILKHTSKPGAQIQHQPNWSLFFFGLFAYAFIHSAGIIAAGPDEANKEYLLTTKEKYLIPKSAIHLYKA